MNATEIELLNFDPDDQPTSQPLFKRGSEHAGCGRPETAGRWIFMASAYRSNVESRTCDSWARNLINQGHRVGKTYYDDVTNYWLWVINQENTDE
jgi:hypothetical protein